jgi:hypothetical protein
MSARTIFVSLVVAAAGCGSVVTMPDNGSDPGSGMPPGAGSASDRAGTYRMQSTFDTGAGMPGMISVVVAQLDAPTSDPQTWVLDRMIAAIGDGDVQSLLAASEPLAAAYMDQQISIAPAFAGAMVALANDVAAMAKRFGLNGTLEIAADDTAVHTVLSVHFDLSNAATDFKLATYQVANVVASGVTIQLDASGTLSIGRHTLALPYGKILRIGIDGAAVPSIDSSANNLDTLFEHAIDCVSAAIAADDAVYDDFGIEVGVAYFESACHAGLQAGASAVYDKVAAIDQSSLELDVTGTANAVDTDHDDRIDALQAGTWSGTLSYSGSPAPLATATFTGARM